MFEIRNVRPSTFGSQRSQIRTQNGKPKDPNTYPIRPAGRHISMPVTFWDCILGSGSRSIFENPWRRGIQQFSFWYSWNETMRHSKLFRIICIIMKYPGSLWIVSNNSWLYRIDRSIHIIWDNFRLFWIIWDYSELICIILKYTIVFWLF